MVEKKDIEELIIQRKKSTLKNHSLDALFYNVLRYSGEIREKEILIWRSAYFLRGAYPVFHLSFNKNDQLNGIRTEMNPFGKIVGKISILAVVAFSLTLLFWNDLTTGIFQVLFILSGAFILYLIMRKAEKEEKKRLTEELQNTIEEIERTKFPERFEGISKTKPEPVEKVWTFKKILIRLVFYPFCILLIYVSATGLIPNGKGYLGLFGIAVSVLYLVADLSSIFKKRVKTTANTGYNK